MTFHGAAREAVERFERDRREGHAAYRVGVSEYGRRKTMTVEVGVTVRSDPSKLRGADDEISQRDGSFGGIVLEVLAVERTDDEGTITTGRMYRTFDPEKPWDEAFHMLDESVIDPARTERTPDGVLSRAIKTLARVAGQSAGRHGYAMLTVLEAQQIRDANRLTGVLMGEARRG